MNAPSVTSDGPTAENGIYRCGAHRGRQLDAVATRASTRSGCFCVGPLPLIVGVTGHRDLRDEDLDRLRGEVRAEFARLRASYPHTPIWLLSGLAEGADRLAAREFLALKEAHAQGGGDAKAFRLVAVLPMPQAIYMEDFQSGASTYLPSRRPDSISEFHELLAAADSHVELPVECEERALYQPGPARDAQYERLGAYIVLHSQILIALWNGKDTGKRGGTSQIVKFMQSGLPPEYATSRTPLDALETGPIRYIDTPRASDPDTVPAREERSMETFEQIFKHIEGFNRDALECASEAVKKSCDDLFPAEKTERFSPSLRSLVERYALADALAIHFAGSTRKTARRLFMLVFVAAAAFDVFAHLPHNVVPWAVWTLLWLFLIVSAYDHWVVHRRARNGEYQTKYLEYRALAEGLRVQLFWRLSGYHEAAVDHYLRKQRTELDWIIIAMRTWDFDLDAPENAPAAGELPASDRLELTLDRWVRSQQSFFKDRGEKDGRRAERFEGWETRLLTLGMVLAAMAAVLAAADPLLTNLAHLVPRLHALTNLTPPMVEWLLKPWGHMVLVTFIAISFVSAGLLHGYAQHIALSQHAKQYKRMSDVHKTAHSRLCALRNDRKLEDTKAVLDVIAALGREALMESGDWLQLHRERPLEIPPG